MLKFTVLAKYPTLQRFFLFFLKETATKLPERSDTNKPSINLEPDKPLYMPIYSLEPIELEFLKTYVNTILANSFIHPSKSLTRASIPFVQISDSSLYLYVNYQDLNNLTIKNHYPPTLIRSRKKTNRK